MDFWQGSRTVFDWVTALEDSSKPTQGLLGAIAQWGDGVQNAASGARLAEIPGMVPSLANLPAGCAFADRCSHVQATCRLVVPPLVKLGSACQVACILAESNLETA